MTLQSLRLGLRRLFNNRRAERDLADEVDHYLRMAAEEHIRCGVRPAEAARLARLQMGAVEAVKDNIREAGWEARIETCWRDLRYAVRGLARHQTFTAAAVLTLAIAIGMTAAMFTIVNGVMLRPLPFPDAHQLAVLWTDDVRRGLHQEPTASATIDDWRQLNHSFTDIALYRTERAALTTPEGRQRARIAYVSPNLFSVLGAAPALGRALGPGDMRVGQHVAVISHSLWQRRFAGDPAAIGQPLVLDDWQGKGVPPTLVVVGVMPPAFAFPDRPDVWTPATTYWRWTRERVERFPSWARRWNAIGRLKSGASIDDAREDFGRIASRLEATHRSDTPDFPGFAVNVEPLLDTVAGPPLQRALWLLMGAVSLVLLIGCVNVGNLLLARGASRQHEFAVRRALGASRARLVRQLLFEALALAAIGGAAGVLLAFGATRALAAISVNRLPRLDQITVDTNVLLFAAVASVAAGLLFGLVPALRLADHGTSLQLREASGVGSSPRAGALRGALVAAECTLAVVLLVGAGLLLRSLARVHAIDPGFDPRQVLVLRVEFGREAARPALVPPGDTGAATARVEAQRMQDLFERIAGLPGVEHVAFVDDMFIAGRGNESITFPGRPSPAGELHGATASPQLFAALRVPLRAGRYFEPDDARAKIRAMWTLPDRRLPFAERAARAIAEPVIVNDAFVNRYLPDAPAIGERFCMDPTGKTYCFEIIGVVGNMHRQGPERAAIPEYYGPFLPRASQRADLLVRIRGDALAAAPSLRQIVAESFAGAIVPSITMADAAFSEFSAQRTFHTLALTLFAAVALLLAGIGIYGVVHYSVSQRVREMAVRILLGARPRDVLSDVVASGMRLPLLGIACGLLLAFASARVMTHLIFGVASTDLVTFAAVATTLCAVALAACYVPARRAARLDAAQLLRSE